MEQQMGTVESKLDCVLELLKHVHFQTSVGREHLQHHTLEGRQSIEEAV